MLVRCPLSGIKYQLTSMPGTEVTALHPITAMPLTQLNEMRIPSDAIGAHLYLCGYIHKLHEMGLILYGSIPISREFSAQWILQKVNDLVRIANWLALNPAHNAAKMLPALRITETTTPITLQEWAQECCQIIDNNTIAWSHKRETEKVRKLLDSQFPQERGDFFEAALDRELADQKIRRVPAITRGRYLLRWISESFGASTIITASQFQQIRSVLKTPTDYPFPVLQQVKAFVLDYGLERSIEQKNEKDMVLKKLDEAMVKKAGVAALLGNGIGGGNGGIGSNSMASANSKGTTAYTVLSGIPAAPEIPSKPANVIPVPTTEPKISDYPNRLAYAIAAKKWRESKTS